MQHIGIDLGGKESQVCIRDGDEKILSESRVITDKNALSYFFKAQPKSRIVMETCSESFAVARLAQQAGHDVNIIPASVVKSLGVGARGVKTDVKDARTQSVISCRLREELPKVHVPTQASSDLRQALTMRESLVEMRTQASNTVRSYLRYHLLKVSCTPKTMPEKVRKYWETHQKTVLPSCVERQLQVIACLNEQLKSADAELKELSKADKTARLLMSVPGVGPVTALCFMSTVDDVSRFPNAHQLESYFGLTPGEYSSSGRHYRTGITKAGPSGIRRNLAQACWCLYRTRPDDPITRWGLQIALRKHKNVAITAMCRKLAGVLYAMWRDNRAYNPKLLECSHPI